MTTREKEPAACKICTKDRQLNDLPPRRMVVVGMTDKKPIEVLACEVCDGSVVKLAQRG
jgi:hypothetical protein